MTPFVPHCAYCNRPLRDCGGVCDGEREALMRAVCDALSMVNVPAPVTAPIGGAPAMPVANRFVLRYGVYVCSVCGFAEGYCRGHAPPAPPAQDGAESGLERRIRDCQGGR